MKGDIVPSQTAARKALTALIVSVCECKHKSLSSPAVPVFLCINLNISLPIGCVCHQIKRLNVTETKKSPLYFKQAEFTSEAPILVLATSQR